MTGRNIKYSDDTQTTNDNLQAKIRCLERSLSYNQISYKGLRYKLKIFNKKKIREIKSS